jgi:Flp pilus assembly protein TadB
VRVWRLIEWIAWAVVQRDVVRVGDRDRERAAVMLREHYAGGYLTLDELSHRTGRVLTARSRGELRRALSGLSRGAFFAWAAGSDPWELAARGRALAQTTARAALLVVLTGAYFAFSCALVFVLALTLLIHGASNAALVALLLVWLVPTYLLARMWRRRPH